MLYKILADSVIFFHLIWIIFILVGIFYVGSLSVLGKYCPLTILENKLREQVSPEQIYPGSFIAHYLEKIVYPEIDPLLIQIPTLALAIFTILIFVLLPPLKIKQSVKKIF